MTVRVIVIAECDVGRLNASTAKCVTCARDIVRDDVTVAVFAPRDSSAAAEAARIDGVARVLHFDAPAHALAATLAPQVAKLIDEVLTKRDEGTIARVKKDVRELTDAFPLYERGTVGVSSR